jgi:acyl-CoA synthetase (AMP-forming)/AMP-acid ligase II
MIAPSKTIRRRGLPRLGHDRDEPARHARRAEAGIRAHGHETRIKYKLKQGRPPFGVEMKIVDDDGKELPHDGKTFGRLMVRGPASPAPISRAPAANILDKDGFFDTGDVATIDELGYMQITDRAKDVIKSGGEWILDRHREHRRRPPQAWPTPPSSASRIRSGTSARC